MVERFLAKEEVAGSNPVRRSILGRVLSRLRRVAIRRFAPKWRNGSLKLAGVAERYTRSVQNAIPERDWRFKSSRLHHAEMAELVYAQS